MTQPTYADVLKDEPLALFLRNMAKFDRAFCDAMAAGTDFTLRLEISGNKGKLNHVRVYNDTFDRPAGAEAPPGRKSLGVKTD